MIKVYKTDVSDEVTADKILKEIRRQLPGSVPSFDLGDRDRVLRIENIDGKDDQLTIKNILHDYGQTIEILP
ncbi:hypothetical protein G3569_01995 [Aliifodinibius halophilus]|uniref:Uncharacterized protein n=2 Tax=Fodinibius halophilus TaxID=1736908 RepID=A0A6M1T9S3_9BACT|nr:hypothetical protein [Fodinibius halophilus]